jgi:hypothetical protein
MIKRILKFFFWVIIIGFLALLIWIKLPLKDAGVSLEGKNRFLLAVIDISKEDAGFLEEVSEFKFQEEYVFKSPAVRWLVGSGGKFFLPIKISVIGCPHPDDPEDFKYLAVIKSASLRRLLQLPLAIWRQTKDFNNDFIYGRKDCWQVMEARDQDEDVQVIAAYKDTLIIANSRDLFRTAIKELPVKQEAESNKGLLQILVNNEYGMFEYYVNELKDEASYNIFRSAGDLKKINISLLDSNVANYHQGQMSFDFKAGADLENSKKDVRFFMQLIRRMLDANSYVFKYTIEEQSNSVKVDYNVQKVRREN